MHKIQHIIEHIKNVYEFEIVTYKKPINNFECFKIFLYSYKLFNFLSKISPIKYKLVRHDRSIRLNKFIILEGSWMPSHSPSLVLFEIEITPITDSGIKLTDYKKIFEPIVQGNYKVKFYDGLYPRMCIRTFPINYMSGIKSIDANLSDVPEFKELLRDYKLKNILSNV